MIILRLFLYLICIISIGWSILVFGGPPIIKRLISGYSDGALMPSGVTVSPRLSIEISRLEFNFQNKITGRYIEGFSRAAEISWSLFGEKPFIEINLGPSVLKDYATADSINFFTPSFQKIDWQNIAFIINVDTLALNSFSKMNSLSLAGNLNLESAKVLNVKIDAENLSADYGGSNYSTHLIKGDIGELNLIAPLNEQLFSSTFVVKNMIVSEPNLTVPEAMIEFLVDEEARNFKFNIHNIHLAEFDGSIENLKVDGLFTHSNVLQELNLVFKDFSPHKNTPKFPEISANAKKSGDALYQVLIEGRSDEFELSNSKNLIGSLPHANFVINLELDRPVSKLTSISKINFSTLSDADIDGTLEIGFGAELLTDLGCTFWDCELSDFSSLYKINFDDEWVHGSTSCLEKFCVLSDMEHLVRTSNTVNILTILNQAKILNPLSSMYLFSAISSGRKINGGHELKFQF